jgi:two-component system, OmpR family, sensor histidine kinase KdpD
MGAADDDRRGRRNPEAWLQEAESAERAALHGQLKIFLGYGPAAGSSFRLFDEARRRFERGEDVVVGAPPPDMPSDVEALVRPLPSVPMRQADGDTALDVEALLARRPGVCVVDGLARPNPPGERYGARWEDVAELRSAGITVLTALGIEHIAGQQDRVPQPSTPAPEPPGQVPQAFVAGADEIVVVDAAPAAGAGAAALSVLRQRALLLAAEAVERQLEMYLERQGVPSTWGTQERVLVCMTPRANAARMLAAGRRSVEHFHGELFAVYVVQPNLTDEDRMANERNATLARAQQACLEVLEGRDAVATILDYARRRRITQIFVGHTLQRGWRSRLLGTPLDRLVREAQGIDVRVFPQ